MSESLIRIDGLKKSFGTTQALQGLSFEVPKGQVVGFLGPNGAGKSTTMKILAGYLTPTSGRAFVGGVDVTVDPLATRRRIGYLPENNPLYEEMMVVDYLTFIAEVRQIPVAQRSERLRLAVDRCGLRAVLGKDIGQLSKGYRQRVGLAQAILHDPDLLILDEPTSGLDPNQIVEIRGLIKELGQTHTVILSTHILSEVQSTCARVLIISDGKLVADDAPDHLSAGNTNTLYVMVAPANGTPLDANGVRTAFTGVPGVTSVESADGEGAGTLGLRLGYGSGDPRRAVFDVAVKNHWALLEMRRQQISLEDTFRKLTGGKTAPPAA